MKQRGVKATSLKAKIRNFAKEKKVAPQLILQNFMMERFLNRIAKSDHRDCFVIDSLSLKIHSSYTRVSVPSPYHCPRPAARTRFYG